MSDIDWMPKDDDDSVAAEIVPATTEVLSPREPSKAELLRSELQGMEDVMLHASMEVVGGVMSFLDLDPDNPEKMPEGWIEELGEEAANRRHRAARAGLMSAKEAPVGVKVAAQMVTGIVRARAAEKGAHQTLNVGSMVFIGKRKEYEELEVED